MDTSLRDLERAYLANKDDFGTLSAYNRARRRAGLDPIRNKIVHYVTSNHHHRFNDKGEIDPRYGKETVRTACNATEVWPRTFYPKKYKKPNYTSDKEQVTCKTCRKLVDNPDYTEPTPKQHFAVEPENADPFILCGARWGVPTHLERAFVTCGMCAAKLDKKPAGHVFGLNARARRKQRREAARMKLVAATVR